MFHIYSFRIIYSSLIHEFYYHCFCYKLFLFRVILLMKTEYYFSLWIIILVAEEKFYIRFSLFRWCYVLLLLNLYTVCSFIFFEKFIFHAKKVYVLILSISETIFNSSNLFEIYLNSCFYWVIFLYRYQNVYNFIHIFTVY